ncbi:hypothetical protein E2C01_095809 [Portunus trituberculatus]|uniref:Uncharacterized protein n=1 Tax=Portunus trituberculatus TaxID=210409 RepID=A0A5B7JWB4_PORTR|nr:hypothetical protein [Portunus trituberculatus]
MSRPSPHLSSLAGRGAGVTFPTAGTSSHPGHARWKQGGGEERGKEVVEVVVVVVVRVIEAAMAKVKGVVVLAIVVAEDSWR